MQKKVTEIGSYLCLGFLMLVNKDSNKKSNQNNNKSDPRESEHIEHLIGYESTVFIYIKYSSSIYTYLSVSYTHLDVYKRQVLQESGECRGR